MPLFSHPNYLGSKQLLQAIGCSRAAYGHRAPWGLPQPCLQQRLL